MLGFAARPGLAGSPPTRRDLLRIGLPSLLASQVLASKSHSAPKQKARAKSVLVVFCSGGQSQYETWDPKPNAPAEVRGAFSSIPTTVSGIRVCEHLPRLAKLAHRYTILRSMTHDDVDHGSACYLSLTGQFHTQKSSNPPPKPTDYPALGAVLQRVRPDERFPHAAFHVNGPLLAPREDAPGQFGGFLGRGYDPIELGAVDKANALLEGLHAPDQVNRDREMMRRGLLDQLQHKPRFNTPGYAEFRSKAHEMIDKPAIQKAFDLNQESKALRDRYGRYRGGQACLLGRRLVEAGVPWVTVFFNHNIRGQDDMPWDADEYGWDTHNDIFESMKDILLPRFDQSFSTLLEDMHDRGLLKETLVVCLGEFGRAPLIAKEKTFAGITPGRKHWGRCYSIVLAGAGITPGAVYGASDRLGAYPQSNPVMPGDLFATLFDSLGIPADTHYTDPIGRTLRITSGNPIPALFS